MAETTIIVTELPEKIQKLFLEVERSRTPLTVTQAGEPFVIIQPATTVSSRPKFGVMQGSGEIVGDLIYSVSQTWNVIE